MIEAPREPIASRSLSPIVWACVAGALLVDLIVIPLREPGRLWADVFPANFALSLALSTAQVVQMIGAGLTVIVLAFTFGWPSTRALSAPARATVDSTVAVLVASQIVATIATAVWLRAVDFPPHWALFEFAALALALAEARILWLAPPERRAPGRPVGFTDRALAIGLVLSGVLVTGVTVSDGFGPAVDRQTQWLFLLASALPYLTVVCFLWLLASPHPQGMGGRDVALGLTTLVVLAVLGTLAWGQVLGGGLNISLETVSVIVLLLQAYLIYWAWEHVENELIDFDDSIDWDEAPHEVRILSE